MSLHSVPFSKMHNLLKNILKCLQRQSSKSGSHLEHALTCKTSKNTPFKSEFLNMLIYIQYLFQENSSSIVKW